MTSEVDLGILLECESWFLTSRFFPSKVGGKPAWLSLRDLPDSESLQCDSCKEPTILLCQVYAPIDEQPECFHRTIFVFICTNGLCCKVNNVGNLKVFRSQLPRINDFYSSNPPEEIEGDVPLALPPLCAVCGCSGRFQCGNCHLYRYCSKIHQVAHWKSGHKSLCKTLNQENSNLAGLLADTSSDGFLLKEWLLDIDAEPSISPNGDETDDLQRRMSEFKLMEKNNEVGTMADVPDKELENFAMVGDKMFMKFSKRVSLHPEQVLRFNRGGEPLWISDKNTIQPENVPPCQYCNGPRVFEFQIMPQLLNNINVTTTACSIDWGVLCIYTCKKSCDIGSAYKKEFIHKQDIINK